jgi:hypothetical protein
VQLTTQVAETLTLPSDAYHRIVGKNNRISDRLFRLLSTQSGP